VVVLGVKTRYPQCESHLPLVSMETTMHKTALTIFGALLMLGSVVQMAAASEHHARKAHATAIQQFRNSNAYAAPVDTPAQSSYLSNLAEGWIASGAGR
jgi:hypothetical protein